MSLCLRHSQFQINMISKEAAKDLAKTVYNIKGKK